MGCFKPDGTTITVEPSHNAVTLPAGAKLQVYVAGGGGGGGGGTTSYGSRDMAGGGGAGGVSSGGAGAGYISVITQ
jgi:hypothetical protein